MVLIVPDGDGDGSDDVTTDIADAFVLSCGSGAPRLLRESGCVLTQKTGWSVRSNVIWRLQVSRDAHGSVVVRAGEWLAKHVGFSSIR